MWRCECNTRVARWTRLLPRPTGLCRGISMCSDLAPAPMEARGIVARYESDEDMLTVWNSTQVPHRVRDGMARVLGRSQESTRVIAPDVGGGFGEKDTVFPEDVLIPYLALTLRQPIKWVEDRQENMVALHARGHSLECRGSGGRGRQTAGDEGVAGGGLGGVLLGYNAFGAISRGPSYRGTVQDACHAGERARGYHEQASNGALPGRGRGRRLPSAWSGPWTW